MRLVGVFHARQQYEAPDEYGSITTMSETTSRSATVRRLALFGLIAIALLVLSLFIGRYPKPFLMPPRILFNDTLAQRLVLYLRLPRLLVAFMMGMALSTAGFVMQMLFRNPLVSPGFLGVSQGAAFGAALSILLIGWSPLMVQVMAGTFAFAGLILSFLLARNIRFGGWHLRLVLAGIAVSALFSSGVGVIKYLADPLRELPDIVFWMLGGLYAITWDEVLIVTPIVFIALAVMIAMRWRLNILTLNDESAYSLGAAPGRERVLILVAAVAATAAVIAVSGLVSWVGLIVPHIARRLFGADAQYSLPASTLIGGIFAVMCDDLARTILAGEIPLGIITSLLGALAFALIFASHHAAGKST